MGVNAYLRANTLRQNYGKISKEAEEIIDQIIQETKDFDVKLDYFLYDNEEDCALCNIQPSCLKNMYELENVCLQSNEMGKLIRVRNIIQNVIKALDLEVQKS